MTATMPQGKKRPKLSVLAKTILKNASLRCAYSRYFRDLGINLDQIMPDNTRGLRLELFASHMLNKPATTIEGFPEALKEEFGVEKGRVVAILLNKFIVGDKIRLKLLPKPKPKKKEKEKEQEEVVEVEEEEFEELEEVG